MPQNRLPKKILFSEVSSGHRARGRPLLRFLDRIRDDLRHGGIREDGVEEHCAKRAEWRKRVYTRMQQQQKKRWRDKGMTQRKRVTDLVMTQTLQALKLRNAAQLLFNALFTGQSESGTRFSLNPVTLNCLSVILKSFCVETLLLATSKIYNENNPRTWKTI